MLRFPSDIQLLPPTQLEQFRSFLALRLLGLAPLLLPRTWFMALLKIAFPILPEDLDQFRENDHD